MFFFWYSKKTEKVKPKKKESFDAASIGKGILGLFIILAIYLVIKNYQLIIVLALIAAIIFFLIQIANKKKMEKAEEERSDEVREILSSTNWESDIHELSYRLESEIKTAVNTKEPEVLFDSFDEAESIMKKTGELSLEGEDQEIADKMRSQYDEFINNKQQLVSGMINWNLEEIARKNTDNKAQVNYEFAKRLQPFTDKIEEAGVEVALIEKK
ncbi:MAG: hypothetical protein K6A90_15185 [Lachnospiraceae bacterium]|nr:hypothetical protein [Lachnospiraceae bacterium]